MSTLDDKLSLMRSTVAVTIMMLLKSHLKLLYGLSEESVHPCVRLFAVDADHVPRKCAKWVQGKKSALGDKAAVRRHDRPLVWDRVPFATRPMLTTEDAETQKSTVSRNVSSASYSPDTLASSSRSGTRTACPQSLKMMKTSTEGPELCRLPVCAFDAFARFRLLAARVSP
jgi:hypothetical protein